MNKSGIVQNNNILVKEENNVQDNSKNIIEYHRIKLNIGLSNEEYWYTDHNDIAPMDMNERQSLNQVFEQRNRDNLLNMSLLHNNPPESEYESYGFVYKIKMNKIGLSSNWSFKNLKNVRLICNDPEARLKDNIPFEGEMNNNSQDINQTKITVYHIPETMGRCKCQHSLSF